MFGIMLLFIAAAAGTASQGVLLGEYIGHYSLTKDSQGYVSSAQSAGLLLSVVSMGALSGRFKKTSIILTTGIAIAAVFFAASFALPFALLLVCYGGFGVAFGMFDATSSSMLVDIDPENSAKKMNLMRACYSIGGLVLPVVLERLLGVMGWNMVLRCMACFAAAAAAVYFLCSRPFCAETVKPSGSKGRINSAEISRFLKRRGSVTFILCLLIYGMHQTGFIVWISRFVNTNMDANGTGVYVLSAYWGGVTLARLIASKVKLSFVQSVIAGNLVATAVLAAGILSGSVAAMTACAAAAGLAEGTVIPFLMERACHMDAENTALGASMAIFIVNAGCMLSPPLIGLLTDSFGGGVGMSLIVVTGALCAVFGWLNERALRETK